MKLLIATRGNSLESLLATNARVAEWYLVVDSATHEVSPVHGIGRPFREIAAAASAHGVLTLLSGSADQHSKITLNAGLLAVCFAEELTAREALERWEQGALRYLTVARTGSSVRHRRALDQPWMPGSIRRQASSMNSYIRQPTPRYSHHLQQYGGRGH